MNSGIRLFPGGLALISSFLIFSKAGAEPPAIRIPAPGQPTINTAQVNIFRPVVEKPTDERIKSLELAKGFTVSKFAENLGEPRLLAVSDAGHVYVTRRGEKGDVLLLKDSDHDGKAEAPVTVATIPDVHGIAIQGNKIYLSAIREVYVADIQSDGKLSPPILLYKDLPDAGQHPNRSLKFSPAGELFLSVGSTCNAAPEANKESATMLKIRTDGSGRSIFATGLRNTIGFDWNPQTASLWGMDHGIDWMGDEMQQEELNLLKEGSQYGWPYVFEKGKANLERNPQENTGLSWEEYAKTCENMKMGFAAHSAPMSFLFYTGDQFPPEYRNNAFVTFHGSWNRNKPSGYNLMRVVFDKDQPLKAEIFLSGFLINDNKAQFGRPCGLAMAKDGSLLMSDDSAGVIYRISYDSK